MATQNTSVSSSAWTALGTALTVCVLQARGDVLVNIGNVAPAAAATTGFLVKSGVSVELPSVAALGGGVWVKSVATSGGVVYATA